ncbi:sugar ABC transporter ATP-binding protein [Jiangella aurantiaca]|uniref:Sugar ABC transporter ATP-binding protein n=1 Tax=Jiangella aurantiaca TaxID=2530373 RepID=A0A4R4ZZM8_9ACTN|nr:sugar ABC transporter ATP-binding protein [Jiangella aurantiaca]TDD64555.1 sugar ABC transporter ATP-binding protein [Jiangella aurantiaca]
MTGSPPVLSVDGLTKRYPGVTALDGMSFEVRAHEVVGLIGENGAGKSTLLKSLVGLVTPDAGTIRVRGEAVRLRGVAHAGSVGIGMVFQEQSLVPNLTVAENILLGAERSAVRGGVYRWRTMTALAQEQLDKIGSTIDPRARTDTLTFAQRQMVEVAKVLTIEERIASEPVVLLDEPTSVLERDEIATLFAQIERLRKRASVVFVSHRLDEVLEVSDRVYVLRNGRVVAEVDPATVDATDLHHLLIGRESGGSHYHDEAQHDCDGAPVRLRVEKLSTGGCRDVSFDIRAGEVLGVAGVQGSGREDVCRALFGAIRASGGRVTLDDRPFRLGSPRAAVRSGVGYVPSERRTDGIVPPMSVAENLSMAHVGEVCAGPVLQARRERGLVEQWVRRLGIKTPSPQTPIGTLSGGNQQKVVLARWMIDDDLRLLILDHPTRGLDVGAKSDVYALIRDLAAAGCAVLLLSDTLEETIALSHRVVVMKDGEVVTTVETPKGAKPDPVVILEEMV